MENEPAIYAIRNLCNGKMYVGRSVKVKDRVHAHLQALKSNRHVNADMQSDFNKGMQFRGLVLERGMNGCYPGKEEYKWMVFFHTYDPKFGYNTNDKFFRMKGAPTRHFKEVTGEQK